MTGADKLRLMLVDDSGETREYMRRLLQFEAHIELVGMASNGKDAVELARETKPDLILMDINMPVMDGISAAEIIFREMPTIRIVMMSVQSEMAYLRRAMQVGAREFLIKPFTHEELMETLGEVSSLKAAPDEVAAAAPELGEAAAVARPAQMATMIAVFSPRGGAGCSTVALNLSIALQGRHKVNVLLMDGNLRFGALDAMLNLQISRSIVDVLPSLGDNDPEVVHLATLPHTSGVRLLAAPPSPEMADLISVEELRQVVTLGRRRYDYVVADVGSRLDETALFFMDVADCIVVLLTPDIPAIKNARLFLQVAESLEYESDKVMLVLNRAAPRGGITAEAIERHIKHPVALSIPNNPRVATAAINRGVPLIIYEREVDKSMPLTRQLLALTEMMPQAGIGTEETREQDVPRPERVAPPASPPETKKKGFLSGLFGRGK